MIISSRTRQFLLAACLLIASGLFPEAARAHPLGNFTVNHFSRLKIDDNGVRITYIIDMAEIPAFQELRAADTDGNGITSQAELNAYVARVASSYVDGLLLEEDGRPEHLTVTSSKITALPGAGGLQTLRLEYELAGPVHQAAAVAYHRLRYRDTNQKDRIGWRELVTTPGSNVTVFDSSVFSNSVSNELRSYPADMLASPLDEDQAELSWTAGPPPAGAALLRTRNGRPTVVSKDRFAELISVRELTPGIALLGLLLAGVLGAAHALSPGHGKTVVGAYLVGSRGTPRHAAFLGLTVTITHTAGVFALGLATLFASRYFLPERLFPVLSLVSGALVALMGLSLFWRRLIGLWGYTDGHGHTHEHEHTHEHGHGPSGHMHSHGGGRPHSHLPPNDEAISWRNLLALGVSGGLLPCPSALVVLLSAVALHRVGYGLLLVVAFSIGLAATLTGIGLAFVYAGRWFSQFGSVGQTQRLHQRFARLECFRGRLFGRRHLLSGRSADGRESYCYSRDCISSMAFHCFRPNIAFLHGLLGGLSFRFDTRVQTRHRSRSCYGGVNHSQRASKSGKGCRGWRPLGTWSHRNAGRRGPTDSRTQRKTNLTVDTDSALRVDATLAIGTQSDTVTVTSDTGVQVDTVATHLGEVVSGAQMTALPLNGRSYTDLLAIQPGVAPISTLLPSSVIMAGVTGSLDPSGDLNPGNLSINGQRESSNGFMVNGIDVQEHMNGGHLHHSQPRFDRRVPRADQ